MDLDKFPCKQGAPTGQEDGKLKGHSQKYKASGRRPPGSQINLKHQQHTELPNGKYKMKKTQAKQKQGYQKNGEQGHQTNTRRAFIPD